MSDERVIDAALSAWDDARGGESYEEERQVSMRAAILSADKARAKQGYVLVRRDDLRHALTALEYVVEIGLPDDPHVIAHREAIDRLTAALNDGETVTPAS